MLTGSNIAKVKNGLMASTEQASLLFNLVKLYDYSVYFLGIVLKLVSCHKSIIFRKMFRQDLRFQELGFRNLIDLCSSLSSIFHYCRPSTEDFKLYDRSRPLPECAEKVFTVASYSIKEPETENNAVPKVDVSG